jgi:hypothetical protein
MTSAASVLVCALSLLGRSVDSFPPIRLLDVRPPHASADAEAFVDPADPTIYVMTTSNVFIAAQAVPQCGDVQPMRKLASILIHEEWHVRHGSNESGAYAAQLTALSMLGEQQDSRLYFGVRRAMAVAISRQRTTQASLMARAR